MANLYTYFTSNRIKDKCIYKFQRYLSAIRYNLTQQEKSICVFQFVSLFSVLCVAVSFVAVLCLFHSFFVRVFFLFSALFIFIFNSFFFSLFVCLSLLDVCAERNSKVPKFKLTDDVTHTIYIKIVDSTSLAICKIWFTCCFQNFTSLNLNIGPERAEFKVTCSHTAHKAPDANYKVSLSCAHALSRSRVAFSRLSLV